MEARVNESERGPLYWAGTIVLSMVALAMVLVLLVIVFSFVSVVSNGSAA